MQAVLKFDKYLVSRPYYPAHLIAQNVTKYACNFDALFLQGQLVFHSVIVKMNQEKVQWPKLFFLT